MRYAMAFRAVVDLIHAHASWLRLRCAVLVAAFAMLVPGPARTADALTILEPAGGAVVRPGQSVTFRVTADAALMPAELDIQGGKFGMPVGAQVSGGPDYVGAVDIPADASGPMKFSLALFLPNDGGAIADSITYITLNIVPDEVPLSLEVGLSIRLGVPGTGGAETSRLSVTGVYAGDIERDLTLASLGTNYTSSDPSVATVSAEGVVSSVGIGAAYVTVEHRGVRAIVPVYVTAPGKAAPPPVDVTSQVQVTAGGVRYDPVTGVYAQQVTVRNASQEPLLAPLRLVISDLPEGISLRNDSGKTRTAEPLGSPTRFLPLEDYRGYLAPGESVESVLEFDNRHGRPLKHTIRVFRAHVDL